MSTFTNIIVRAMETSGGLIREPARRLGLARNTLKFKIQNYNIAVREWVGNRAFAALLQ